MVKQVLNYKLVTILEKIGFRFFTVYVEKRIKTVDIGIINKSDAKYFIYFPALRNIFLSFRKKRKH